MARKLLFYSIFMLLLFTTGEHEANAQAPALVNPQATQKAKDVYSYIYNAKYKGLITGQHNYAQTWLSSSETAIRASRLVKDTTGEWPGLWGSDFSFTDPNYTIDQLQDARRRMINVAKSQAQAGSLITLTYHMVTPTMEENQGWDNVQQARLTMEEYEELVTPGTPLYNNWKRNMDRVIPFLKELENDGIAVIWRPYHEMNGLFWWGGGESARVHFNQLWINTYEYMVNNPDPSMKLNNLIWFWSPNHFTSWDNNRVPDPWFPGHEYVDMLGIDDYWWTQEGFLSQGDYDYLVNKAQGKPLAIGEGFNPNMVIPDPEWMMEHRPEYRWFMIWDGQWINDRINDPVRREALTAIYKHENAINQDNIHVPPLDVIDDTPPTVPTNLQATNNEWNEVSLSWDEATDENGVSGYEVFVNGVYRKFTFNLFTKVPDLSADTEYTFTVKARDHYMNRSEESDPLVITTPIFEATPPTVPDNLRLMGRSESTISLIWDASTSNAAITGYNIYFDGELHTTVATTHATLAELEEGQEYNITITGVNDFNQESDPSEAQIVSTYSITDETVIVNNTEFTFTGTWGTSSGSGKYMGTDHWSRTPDAFYTYTFVGTKAYIFAAKAPHHGIAGISINNGEEEMVDYFSPFRINETIVYETPELPMGIHIIKVRVTGTRNPYSTGEVISADRLDYLGGELEDDIPPTVPTDLKVTERTFHTVSLKWEASTDNTSVFGYYIYVDGERKMTSNDTTATITGLSQLTTYSITVKAFDGFENISEASEPLEVTTREDLEINLVRNGGFEAFEDEFNDDHYWRDDNKNGHVVLEKEHVLEGDNAVRLGPGNWGWISQRLEGWEAGKTYKMSAYGKVGANGNSVRVRAKYNNTDIEAINFTSLDYTYQSIELTIPEDAVTFQIYVTNRTTGTGYIDNVRLVEVDREGPSAPSNLTASDITTNSVLLSWDASEDINGIAEYEIYTRNTLIATTEETSILLEGLDSGMSYIFTVKAKDLAGNLSDASEAIEVTTLPSTVINLVNNGSFEFDLESWTGAAGSIRINTAHVAHGNKALEIGPTAWSWLQQSLTGWEVGKTYRFTITAKTANAGQEVRVAVKTRMSGATSDTDLIRHTVNSTEFTEYSGTYTVEEGITWLQVYMTNRGTSSVGFIDNVRFVLVEEKVPAPTNLTLEERTDSTISLSWTGAGSEQVEAYQVYLDDNLLMTTDQTSATITSLLSDREYVITVRSKDSAGNLSTPSEPLTVMTLPSNEVNLVLNGSFEYDLQSWTGAAGSIHINTEHVAHGSKSLEVGPTSWSWLQQTLSGWEVGQTYRFTITAKTASAGQEVRVAVKTRMSGANSDTDLIRHTVNTPEFTKYTGTYTVEEGITWLQVYTTNRGTSSVGYIDNVRFVLVDEEAPTVPTDLTLIDRTASTVSILWTASTDNVAVAGYQIFVDGDMVDTTDDTFATITDLVQGTEYAITIKAVDTAGNISDESEALMVQTVDTEAPTVPTDLVMVEKSHNSISISWTASEDNVGIDKYEVYVDGKSHLSTEDTSAVITDLTPDTSYTITVIAIDDEGNISIDSEALVVRTDADMVSELLPGGSTLKIYPNPFDIELNVQIEASSKLSGNVNFFIQNLSGRIVRQGVLKHHENYELSLDTYDLPAGIYVLRLVGRIKHTSLIMKK